MTPKMSRREYFRWLGAAGIAGLGTTIRSGPVAADIASRADAPPGVKVDGSGVMPCTIVDGQVIEPRKTIPTIHETDVLVIGAGPAGVCAAIGAARAGSKVTLVERYNHFGGLSTGGLVLVILGHIVDDKTEVCRGIGGEFMQRLEKYDHGIVNRRPGVNPTVDAEVFKYLMVEMVQEANIDVFLHSWAVDAIMEGSTIRGVVFDSKSGRRAILAKQVVATTGDGDIFAAAGAEHERRLYHIGLPYRIGNLDKVDKSKTKGKRPPRHLGGVTPINGVRWVNMHGPDADGLDVKVLSRLELEHRCAIWRQVQEVRKTPGYEDVYLMETAPQMGVRISRVLTGVKTLTLDGVKQRQKFDDCVALGGAWHADHQPWEIPYGALLPKGIDNLLTAGRSTSGEPLMSDLIRVIPICWVTGHAAGCAAAIAASDGCPAREVEIPKLRRLLQDQGAYLG